MKHGQHIFVQFVQTIPDKFIFLLFVQIFEFRMLKTFLHKFKFMCEIINKTFLV